MKRKRAILFGWIALIVIGIITAIAACIVSSPRVNYPIVISGSVLIAIVLIILWPRDYLLCSFAKKDKKVP